MSTDLARDPLAESLAMDILAAAAQYPAVRRVRTFGDLHTHYDANESVIAACEAVGIEAAEENFDRMNAATDVIDALLQVGGLNALRQYLFGPTTPEETPDA